jgi:hypothetical protein
MPGALRGYVLQGIDPGERTAISVAVSDTTEKFQRLGSKEHAKNGPASGPECPDIKVPYPGPADNDILKANVTAEMQRQLNMMGVHIEVETLGVPDLIPGEVIEIRGMGKRLDSTYAVFTINHSIGIDGFTTSFTAVSNVAQMLAKASDIEGVLNDREAMPADQQGTVVATADATQGTVKHKRKVH